jgi:hypothetical protein
MEPESGHLGKVARGLQFIWVGSGLLLATLVAGPLAVPLGLFCGVLVLVGRICCLAVPRKCGCLRIIRGSVLCTLLAFLLVLTVLIFFRYERDLIVVLFIPLFAVAGEILFLIFLRRLADYVGKPQLARRARSILIAGLVISALGAGLTYLAMHTLWQLVSLIGILSSMAGFAIVILYAILINSVRRATLDHVAAQAWLT